MTVETAHNSTNPSVTDNEEDQVLQCHFAVAQALRLAYERNRQAERYHLRGALSAARYEANQLAQFLSAAQQQLLALESMHN
jgi:hypothetical protein